MSEGYIVHADSCEQYQGLRSIRDERRLQTEKWGKQRHIPAIWSAILNEECGEFSQACLFQTFEDKDYIYKMRHEAVQVAAVALQIIEMIDEKCPSILNSKAKDKNVTTASGKEDVG